SGAATTHEEKDRLLDRSSPSLPNTAELPSQALPHGFCSNQNRAVDAEVGKHLRQILWEFRAPIRYAIAYGSGVFAQGASPHERQPMIDLIFGVTHTQHFHSLNLRQYRHHYSFLGVTRK